MVWGVAPSLSHEKAHVKSTFKKAHVNHTGARQLVQAYVHSKADTSKIVDGYTFYHCGFQG